MPKGIYQRTESTRKKLSEFLSIHKCYSKGSKMPDEIKKKISVAKKGKIPYVMTLEVRNKISLSQKGIPKYGGSRPNFRGKNHPGWIEDRSLLKKYSGSEERRSQRYRFWRKEVWLRDNFKCKLANPDCLGKMEVHHILPWKDYEEHRYKLTNGITLCHAHHPRKRAEEKRLIPIFQELVSASNL